MSLSNKKGKGRRGGFCGGRLFRWFGKAERTANCICPQCGFTIPHDQKVPCFQKKCPKCGSAMTRKFFSE